MKKFPLWVLFSCFFCFLFGCSESGYHKKGGKWHFDGELVRNNTDPSSFVPLNDYFAKDAHAGYFRGMTVYAEDGNTTSDGPTFVALNNRYAKDKARVYYGYTDRDSREYWSIKRVKTDVVPQADAPTFQLLGDNYTARDKAHVFREKRMFSVRDINSYQTLEHLFAKDKISGYYFENEIKGSDGPSFLVIDPYYARDRSKIYFVDVSNKGISIQGVRNETFKNLDDGYATDGSRAYYRGKVIATEEAGTLQAFGRMGYAKTSRQVFHDGNLMPSADAGTFAMVEGFNPDYDATDRSARYSAGARLPN